MTRTVLALACAAAAGSALAATPLPPSAADLSGARALALGGCRGLDTGNDDMFTNPAMLALRRRYSVETQYLLDRQGATAAAQWVQGSVVDSVTSPTAAGFAFTRLINGLTSGNLLHLPVAGPIGGGLYGGFTVKYYDVRASGVRSRNGNVDAGLYWQGSSLIGIGVAGYNLVPVSNEWDQPQSMGAGLHVGDDKRFNVTFDWRGDFKRRGKATSSWAGGAELLLADVIPVRGGFVQDDTRGGNFWSVGLGFVTTAGVAADVTYRQGIRDAADRTFAAGLKLQLPGT